MKNMLVFVLAVTVAISVLLSFTNSPSRRPGVEKLDASHSALNNDAEIRAQIRAEVESEERARIRARIEEEERREREIAATEAMAAAMAAQARVAEAEQRAEEQRDLERRQLKQQLLTRLHELRANQSAVGSITRAQEEQEIVRQLTILEAVR